MVKMNDAGCQTKQFLADSQFGHSFGHILATRGGVQAWSGSGGRGGGRGVSKVNFRGVWCGQQPESSRVGGISGLTLHLCFRV